MKYKTGKIKSKEKRPLTIQEIQKIKNSITPFNLLTPEITKNVFDEIFHKIQKKLQNIEINPIKIPELTKEIQKSYYESQITAGENVGIITAQNIGERCTQWTLDSFHYSGSTITTVITGVPRFTELINATKFPKNVITNIYFNNKLNSPNEIRNEIQNNISSYNLNDIVLEYNIKQKKKRWYRLYNIIHNDLYKKYTHYIECKISPQFLFLTKMTLYDISTIIEREHPYTICVYSPLALNTIDIWTDIPETDTFSFVSENTTLLSLSFEILPKILKTCIVGIDNMKQYMFKQTPEKEWYLEVSGYNIKALFSLSFVSHHRSFSNNMWEIFETFGIEAAREFILNEFISVICSDSFVNTRHIELLVDTMCYSGCISSFTRFGLTLDDSGPLAKTSFEKSLDNFLKAAMYGEIETTHSVSSSVMCGKPASIGTGMCSLIYKE